MTIISNLVVRGKILTEMSHNPWKFFTPFLNLIEIPHNIFYPVEKRCGQPRIKGTFSILASLLIKNMEKTLV